MFLVNNAIQSFVPMCHFYVNRYCSERRSLAVYVLASPCFMRSSGCLLIWFSGPPFISCLFPFDTVCAFSCNGLFNIFCVKCNYIFVLSFYLLPSGNQMSLFFGGLFLKMQTTNAFLFSTYTRYRSNVQKTKPMSNYTMLQI